MSCANQARRKHVIPRTARLQTWIEQMTTLMDTYYKAVIHQIGTEYNRGLECIKMQVDTKQVNSVLWSTEMTRCVMELNSEMIKCKFTLQRCINARLSLDRRREFLKQLNKLRNPRLPSLSCLLL